MSSFVFLRTLMQLSILVSVGVSTPESAPIQTKDDHPADVLHIVHLRHIRLLPVKEIASAARRLTCPDSHASACRTACSSCDQRQHPSLQSGPTYAISAAVRPVTQWIGSLNHCTSNTSYAEVSYHATTRIVSQLIAADAVCATHRQTPGPPTTFVPSSPRRTGLSGLWRPLLCSPSRRD